MKRRKFLNIAGSLLIAAGAVSVDGCGGGDSSNSNGGQNQDDLIKSVEKDSLIIKEVKEVVASFRGSGNRELDARDLLTKIEKIPGVKKIAVDDEHETFLIITESGTTYGSHLWIDSIREDTFNKVVPRIGSPKFLKKSFLSPERSVPMSGKAYVLSGFSNPNWSIGGEYSVASYVAGILAEAGYDVEVANTSVELLQNLSECDVLYLAGHGINRHYSFWTSLGGLLGPYGTINAISISTPYSISMQITLQRLFSFIGDDTEMRIFSSKYGNKEFTEFYVTQNFFKNRTPRLSLRSNGMLYVDACSLGSAASGPLKDIFKLKGATVIAGWDNDVQIADAHLAGCWFFDRLAGLNMYSPSPEIKQYLVSVGKNPDIYDPESSLQRPYDWEALKEDMSTRNPRLDEYPSRLPGQRTELKFFRLKEADDKTTSFYQLNPSLLQIQQLPIGGKVTLNGVFGGASLAGMYAGTSSIPSSTAKLVGLSHTGDVVFRADCKGGDYFLKKPESGVERENWEFVYGTSLQSIPFGFLTAQIPEDFVGSLVVALPDGRQSNKRYLNEWRCMFTFTTENRSVLPSDESKIEIHCILRGDVAPVRLFPGAAKNSPIPPYTEIPNPRYVAGPLSATRQSSGEITYVTPGAYYENTEPEVRIVPLPIQLALSEDGYVGYSDEELRSQLPSKAAPNFSLIATDSSEGSNNIYGENRKYKVILKLPALSPEETENGENGTTIEFLIPLEFNVEGALVGATHQITSSGITGRLQWQTTTARFPISEQSDAARSVHL